MCGFALIVDTFGTEPRSGAIASMVESLHHRGPDGSGIQILPGCCLGHTRLAIVDLTGGAQPMVDQQGRYWITFNGEIYNYRELRRELESDGVEFRTHSDTEVILQCYLKYGHSVVLRLNGQFAFAIWDANERRLFAARDRLGEKPFYFSFVGQRVFVAASEIRALEASRLVQPKLSRDSLADYLCLGYVPPDRTIYENVHVLRPGHTLQLFNGDVVLQRYWSLPASSSRKVCWRDVVAEARHLLRNAVERQMVADVPVGAFLSGGLDSSTIVALMASAGLGKVKTFSVGFGDLINELPYARAVAERYNTEHHEVQMDMNVAKMMRRLVEVYDEPLADSASIPTCLIADFARQHVKVVLAGEGGDEVFGGYWWHQQLIDEEKAPPTAAGMIAARVSLWCARLARRAGGGTNFESRAGARYLGSLAKRSIPDAWDRCLQRHLMPPDGFVGGFVSRDATARRLCTISQGPSERLAFDRVTDFDLCVYLAGDILAKADRASMSHGLEVRSPFLDLDLLNFVLALPWQTRMEGGGGSKPLLRAAVSELWPDSVKVRRKQGFGAPVDAWVSDPAVKAIAKVAVAASSPLNYCLPGVAEVYERSTPQQQWTLACLGLWMERHSAAL